MLMNITLVDADAIAEQHLTRTADLNDTNHLAFPLSKGKKKKKREQNWSIFSGDKGPLSETGNGLYTSVYLLTMQAVIVIICKSPLSQV